MDGWMDGFFWGLWCIKLWEFGISFRHSFVLSDIERVVFYLIKLEFLPTPLPPKIEL